MNTAAYDLILRDVTFRYGPHAEPVLRNLTLTVPAGDHLAIVGPSGIGKSTLAGLLCGLLRPNSGAVTIGGAIAVDLPPDRLAELRTLIPQEAYVFAGRVWDNLTYLCSTATPRQVDNAVAAMGAEPLIAKLGGVSAQLTPAELSAGERQLIALVRSYLSAAPVVVLDEATCHLDPSTERRVEEAFAVRPGTLIVIAHRVSSALRARRILVLDGASAAVGDHLTLLATSPLYRELLGHWQVVPAPATEVTRPVPAAEVPARLPAARPPEAEPAEAAVAAAHSSNGSVRASGNGSGGADDAPWRIFGQVSENGRGSLEGTTLTLTDLSGRQLDRDVSDAEGHYRLGPLAGGSYLVICASGAYQPRAALVAVADAPVRHDVVLSSGGADVSGCVSAAEDGSSIAGAVVTLVDVWGDVVGAARTGADGRFGFEGVGQGHYTVTVAAPSLQPVAQGLEVPAGGQVVHDVGVVARMQLAGLVRSATAGLPVPEALATLVAGDGQVVGSQITDERGGFVFDDLTVGVYTVIATGYPPVAAEVSLGSGEPTETVITVRPPTLPDTALSADFTVGNGAVLSSRER